MATPLNTYAVKLRSGGNPIRIQARAVVHLDHAVVLVLDGSADAGSVAALIPYEALEFIYDESAVASSAVLT